MSQLFGIQLDTLTNILLIITCAIIVGVVLLALGNAIFFKIGVRNIPRRRTQMILIIFALMLSTTLLSSVLAVGDVITAAVQSVAIYNLGNVDETVEGGNGALGFFDDKVYYSLVKLARNYPDIAAVSAAMVEQNLLVADEDSRQVRSKVTALAIIPGSEQGFGGMQNDNGGRRLRIADLASDEVYLNHTTAQLLNAHPGDFIYLYSKRWPAQRYGFRVRAIVANGGLTGDTPFILSQIQPFRDIERRSDDITKVFIANRGGGGVNGVALSDSVDEEIERWIPRYVHIIKVKQQGVLNSQKAENIFSRIFALFSLFVLAIGLLLIFLIFVLLAAERRVEMGMARAIGVQRRHLVLMFLFEGTVYDLLASFFGLGIGVGAGVLLVTFLGPTLARFDFPLKLTFQSHSLVIAYCLGVIFTFCSVAVSSWFVSRMTVVEAIRNLPESGRQALSLQEVCLLLLRLAKQGGKAIAQGKLKRARHIILEQVPEGLMGVIQVLLQSGLLPLLAGYGLMRLGLVQSQIAFFSLGLTLIVVGGGMLIKTVVEQVIRLLAQKRLQANRMFAALAGLAIVAYWALPFDALAGLGLPRFHGGLEVFFIAGLMMVLGAAWALIANAELVVNPLLKLCSWHPRLRIMARLASAYPLHHRFRTGLSVVMFSLVIFAMTVMAVITYALQNTYTNIDVQTGGYDIQAVTYFKPLPVGGDINSVLASNGINPQDFASIGISTATAVGVIQPNAANPAWHLYPARVVSGGFLQGLGLHLTARAQGFDSDSAIWQALQSNSHYALIDSSALPYRPDSFFNGQVYDPNAPPPAAAGTPVNPPGIDPYYAFSMDGIYQGDTTFRPAQVWVTGLQSSSALKLTIIGVVDNSDSAHFGIYIPSETYGHTSADPATPDTQTYYFRVALGQDKHALSLALGSAFLDYGLETTVLEDAIWQVRGPRILLSNILIGVVGMALLLGVAALAITGTRAVIERRQQIGMLRALGCSRRLVQGAFLCESFFVGCIGSLLGVTLGLIISSNIFAVNFFERYQTGLTFSVPWGELGIIVGAAVLASLAAALLPAWQAGHVPPVEALRY